MPEIDQLIWSGNILLLGWLLRQYFKLRRELNLIHITLAKNYATNEALAQLIANQDKMLTALQEIKIDQATLFERIRRFHENEARTKI